MKLTAELIEEGLRQHQVWQELEAARLTDELWAAIFGAPQGDAPRKRWRCRGRRLLLCPDPTHYHNDGCYSDSGPAVATRKLGPFDDEGDDEDDEN